MLQRSKWSGLLLSAAVCTVGSWGMGQAMGQATAPAAAGGETAMAPAGDQKLTSLADDFIHYSLINNVELAKANGEALLSAATSSDALLNAFEASANGRNFRDVIVQDQRRPDLKDIAGKIISRLDEGYRVVARDPRRIRADVDRLASGPRAYQNASEHLMAAGQFAAPIYIEYLQNASKSDLHPFIIRLMGETGRPLLYPLIEELRASDGALRVTLVNVLGQIGYPQALPALRTLQADESTSGDLKNAVDTAIAAIDRSGAAAKMSAADLSLRGAVNFYEKKASYQPLAADEKTNPIWIYDKGLNNVSPVQVPTPIWNDVMAIRMAEATLKMDAANGEAISLWLAATLRRELQLPAGAVDPLREANAPSGSFYLLAAGPVYVNPVLSRALDAHDAALALRAIDALEATGGVSGLVSGDGSPLVRALAFPDRSVRYRAAFALARANPTLQFPSFFRVVPILAEAVHATGAPGALVVSSDNDMRNALSEALRNGPSHFTVYAGATISDALQQAGTAPSFDVVIVPAGSDVGNISNIARNDYRLAGVPVLITASVDAMGSAKAQAMSMPGYMVVDEKANQADLGTALTQARTDAGVVPVNADKAAQYAATALDLLATLGADHRSIYNVTEAVPTLVDALKDKRADIATGAARVLAELNSQDGQRALAAAALATDTDAALRIVYFKALAESAKRTGNALDASAVNGLIKMVSADPDTKTRQAAATALGALNVPSNQASTLILQQAK